MKRKTNKAAPPGLNHTNPTVEPCLFTPSDRKRLNKLLSKESFDPLMALVIGDPMPLPLIGPDGDKIDTLDQIAINWWHDEGYQYIYKIGRCVYVYAKDGETSIHIETHVTNVIREYYPYEEEYFEQACAGFGIKPPLSSVKRGYRGYCCVWINTFFRERRTSSDSSRWARGEEGEIIWFDNYSAARKWINQDNKEHHGYAEIVYPKGHYLYAHNEYAPREYTICK